MKITPKVKKFQQGGTVAQDTAPAEDQTVNDGATAPETVGEEAPQGDQGQDPIAMLAQMAQQALQSQDCNTAMQVCQAFLEVIQQMQGQAPQPAQGEPVFRKGGRLAYRIKK